MDHLHIVTPAPEQQPLPLPAWMIDPNAPPSALKALRRENEVTVFEAKFDHIITQLACGQPLKSLLGDDRRKELYYDAQRIAAELISTQMLDIADASDALEDVQRSTLRINTRKWYLGVLDRKRFGEVKQIDQTVTIDMVGAMEAARERASARAEIIDVQPKELK